MLFFWTNTLCRWFKAFAFSKTLLLTSNSEILFVIWSPHQRFVLARHLLPTPIQSSWGWCLSVSTCLPLADSRLPASRNSTMPAHAVRCRPDPLVSAHLSATQ